MAKSYLVNASAGSGKTYRLTQAVRAHINSSSELVVAITFTRAAAAEMQKRILDVIAGDQLAPPEKLRLLMRAARARFSTIDALFRQLLATEETSPRIADDQDAQSIQLAVDELFFAQPAVIGDTERILIAARVLQIGPEQLLEKLKEIDPAFAQWTPAAGQVDAWRARQARLAAEYKQLQTAVRAIAGAAAGNLRRSVVNPLLQPLDQADAGCALFQKSSLDEIKNIAAGDRHTPAYAKLDKIYPAMRRLLAEHIINSARLASALLKHFHGIYQRLVNGEKQQRGVCFFEDVTRALLELDGPDAAERPALVTRIYERGYDRTAHLLLDEFQDTSGEQLKLLQPLMEDILGSVAADGTGERSLFIVGDWKQSVYRWRGAEPDRLAGWLAPLAKRGQLHEENLPFNWRSTPLLIEYFNHLTAELFKGQPYAAHRQTPPDGSRKKDYSGISRVMAVPVICGRSEDALYAELHNQIKQLQTSAGCAWGDVAVLCRTNAHMHKIAGVLAENGIATSGVRGRELLSLREGTALYLALAALFMPHDGKFIPQALENLGYDAAFRQELARIREAAAACMEPFRFAAAARALRELSRHFPGVLIEAVWHDAERYFDRPAPGAPADWLKHLRTMSPWVAVPEGEHADRVKLATIHSTKGLEFPHVFVLWKEERDRPDVVLHPDDGAPLQLSKKERAFLAAMPESGLQSLLAKADNREQAALEGETANLLYVAATRAISSLTWVLKAGQDGKLEGFSRKISQAASKPIAGAAPAPGGYQHDYGPGAPGQADYAELPPYNLPESEPSPDPDEMDPTLKSAEIEAGIARGLRLHAALARLTPEGALPDNLDLTPPERHCLERFLSRPEVADILRRPGKILCEQHVSDTKIFGLVDRLVIAGDLITIIDYKTGARRGGLLEKYQAQMLRYRQILTALYGASRRIECYLLFVDDSGVIQL